MIRLNRHEDFLKLREQFPFFIFEKQEHSLTSLGLNIRFTFNLANKHKFYPTLFIPRKACFLADEHIVHKLPNIVFNIGMIELISYWKAACAPRIIIQPFFLTTEQVEWWKNIYFHGLGEFFYLNSIRVDKDNFLQIEVASDEKLKAENSFLHESLIIPVGGGKDSAVTLELLGAAEGALPLILNPRKASLDSISARGFDENSFFEIRRTIDPGLLRLNEQGFLNGHTPFSALLGFLTVLASLVTGHRHIALSNESSANEPTIPGTTINHQYSKSYQFETDFRRYVSTWIHPDINYFSFLRPLHELQIASLFAGFPKYHAVFRSCNAGSKTDSWCCNCPKCLFTYIILSPFLADEQIMKIFGSNLLDQQNLLTYFDQLTGVADEKPFDCIGTIDEVNLALGKIIEKRASAGLPFLLDHYRNGNKYEKDVLGRFSAVLRDFSPYHNLRPEFGNLLKGVIHGRTYP